MCSLLEVSTVYENHASIIDLLSGNGKKIPIDGLREI
jgi:hypothetical protein